jgi:hypothetical protein
VVKMTMVTTGSSTNGLIEDVIVTQCAYWDCYNPVRNSRSHESSRHNLRTAST